MPLDSGRRACYNAPIISHAKRCGRGVGRKRRVSESGRWWKSRTGLRLKNTSKPKPNAAWPPVGAAWRRHVTSVGACWGPQRSKSGGTTESGLRPEIDRRSAAKNGGAFYVFHFGRTGKDRQPGNFAGLLCAHGVARAGHEPLCGDPLRLSGLSAPCHHGAGRARHAALLPRRRLCGLQRRTVRLPPPARAAQGEVYIRQRIRLRDTAAPLPRIRPGDVPRAGRGVRAGHLRRGEKQPRRRPRPHRHPPALLWGDRGRRHGLRQRAEGPRGAVRCDPALPARLLLGGRPVRPLRGRRARRSVRHGGRGDRLRPAA